MLMKFISVLGVTYKQYCTYYVFVFYLYNMYIYTLHFIHACLVSWKPQLYVLNPNVDMFVNISMLIDM